MFVRRRRPLLRAALVGGTASYAGKKLHEGQAEQAAPPQAAAAAAPAPAAPTGISNEAIAQLQQLAALKEQGMLSDGAFEVEKRRLLGTA
jgi:hypothetical protein